MNHQSAIEKLHGPHAAIFTPLDEAGRINWSMLKQIIEFQLDAGLHGFFVAGSTGEGLLLSESERDEILRKVVEFTGGRGNVIAHVGHPSTDVSAKLAEAAAKAGADWVASVGPIFHGNTFEGSLRHYQQIANSTDLPFMVYSIGTETVPERDAAYFEIPNVCAMKYTGSNFYSIQQMARFVKEPAVFLSGFDEQFVAALSFGFAGAIGSTLNFAPRIYAEIYRLYQQGDIEAAAKLQSKINRVTYLMAKYENWSYRKAIMRYIGFDCGAYRAPYAPLSESEYRDFAQQLDQLAVLTRD